MKKILYVMNVEWNWIKQRPHFIAEALAETYDMSIIYQHRYKRSGLQNRKNEEMNLIPVYLIPKISGIARLSFVNEYLLGIVIKYYIKCINPDVIYLTYPSQVCGLLAGYKGKIIYDCMDNHPAFICHKRKKEIIKRQEKSLIDRADIVLASSKKLIDILQGRYGDYVMDKIHLVRNGYNGEILKEKTRSSEKKKDLITFTYFGTISDWFDFEYILNSLVDFPNIRYELFGPIDGVKIPYHDRIVYKGVIEHDELLQNTYSTDCFIMPFVINEIIESVDPVKIYEYINFNKNILCPFYPEIGRFEKFVHYYTDYDSYKNQIKKLINEDSANYSEEERERFLLANQWKNRVKIITNCLDIKE